LKDKTVGPQAEGLSPKKGRESERERERGVRRDTKG
jgi:hypothetical protein